MLYGTDIMRVLFLFFMVGWRRGWLALRTTYYSTGSTQSQNVVLCSGIVAGAGGGLVPVRIMCFFFIVRTTGSIMHWYCLFIVQYVVAGAGGWVSTVPVRSMWFLSQYVCTTYQYYVLYNDMQYRCVEGVVVGLRSTLRQYYVIYGLLVVLSIESTVACIVDSSTS